MTDKRTKADLLAEINYLNQTVLMAGHRASEAEAALRERDKAPEVTIIMSLDEAERIRLGLADLLCWHRGFAAGREGFDTDQSAKPLGISEARDMADILAGMMP